MAQYYPKTGVCYDHAERSKIYMIYTFSCNAACDHCLVESSPKRRAKLDPATAKEILRLGAEHGKSFLDLSGGEAMLHPKEVMEVASAARDLGYYVCLNTNAYWARTPDRARGVVADLKAAGVQAIFPSASAYHLKYVPLERVMNARAACQELDVAYELNYFYSAETETDARIQREMDLENEVFFFDGLQTTGNSEETMGELKKLYTMRVPDDIDDCFSVHLGVNPHGHVVSTCNMNYTNAKFRDTPFFLGNFYEQPFEDILRAERESAVLQFLYDNPHPALHTMLREDDEVGEYYRQTFSERRYYSVIDYYIDVFRDERTMSRIDQLLPKPLASI
ncbi:4Fe-4S single cluster domain-containing protein [Saccharopolyspora kobensis]|uniref:4Fe-4S single cluster domain-containing protein n=1 Tax=Saccharopolyspora kobensis TaxID=146035 RepID=A0A1H6E574_9PSEU|nr:radical SAM protein [Saccharopolyspora kobensis]SEG92383.1 4Fe-4S single cluster domain-containing protein [Saccharopolyspora kobensis]SFD37205.1 4Fe-4S single cluster domain-containing protein [Saccharopolyspora kobensis]